CIVEQHLRAQLELLKSPEADLSGSPGSRPRDQRTGHTSPTATQIANGYDELAAASQDAARALNAKTDGADAFIHPDLRTGPISQHNHNMMPIVPSPGPIGGPPPGAPNSSLAPAPQPPQLAPAPGEESPNDGRKAKRALSQSKRAAQNRAAQRAFRQRKESYIKQLEQEVRDYRDMEKSYKAAQSENYALREYVLTLQSRLIDAVGEFPQPPPNINLAHHSVAPEPQMGTHEPGPSHMNAGTPLEAVAQAVAGLAAQEQMGDRSYPSSHMKPEPSTHDNRTAEEINRHLQAGDGGPDQALNV
ncbi:unnamed protein product, partial [Clonostachys solani]